MPTLASIPLDAITIHENIADVPLGHIVQCCRNGTRSQSGSLIPGEVIVGIRAIDQVAPGRRLWCVVQAEGDNAGKYYASGHNSETESLDGPFLDITSRVRLCVTEPTPSKMEISATQFGCVYRLSDGNGSTFLGLSVDYCGRLIGYVTLTGDDAGTIRTADAPIPLGRLAVMSRPEAAIVSLARQE